MMERQLIYLIVLCGLLSGCKQTEVVALANPLNGLYKGDVTYVALTASGEIDTSYLANTHSIAFEITNSTFNRAECGCRGGVSVDTLLSMATFTSSEKACVDGGSNGDSFWSFQNDIIGRFTFMVSGDTLQLTAPGSTHSFNGNLRKTILVVRQNQI
jgi:hypothetical protein